MLSAFVYNVSTIIKLVVSVSVCMIILLIKSCRYHIRSFYNLVILSILYFKSSTSFDSEMSVFRKFPDFRKFCTEGSVQQYRVSPKNGDKNGRGHNFQAAWF